MRSERGSETPKDEGSIPSLPTITNKKIKKKKETKIFIELPQAVEGSRNDKPTSVAGSNPVVNLCEIVKKTGLISQ